MKIGHMVILVVVFLVGYGAAIKFPHLISKSPSLA